LSVALLGDVYSELTGGEPGIGELMKVLLATVLAASFVAASTPVAAKGGPLSSKYYVKLGTSKYSLKKNQIIAKANTVSTGAAYGLGFWILPVKTVSTWSSILHKGRQNNERGPAALFYPGLTRIHFRMATQRNFNDGCDSNAALALKRWSMCSSKRPRVPPRSM
jgi:hypothetical protein